MLIIHCTIQLRQNIGISLPYSSPGFLDFLFRDLELGIILESIVQAALQ